MLPVPAAAMIRRMWAVTTQGDLPDEHESHHHHESVPAWDDYHGRILELEAHGYTQKWEGAAEYGKRWALRAKPQLRTCRYEVWRWRFQATYPGRVRHRVVRRA